MRHKQKRHQLNRFTSWHKATLISMLKNLLKYQSIKTTKGKALAVRPLVEKIITLSKENSLANKRQAYKILGEHSLVSQLFNETGPRFVNRTSGFVRVLNLGSRRGDGADLVVLELTEIKKKEHKLHKKEKKAETSETPETLPVEEAKPKNRNEIY